jgi:hypothetical protein
MKRQMILEIIIILCISACKNNPEEKKSFYPFTMELFNDAYSLYMSEEDILLEWRNERDGLSEIHLLRYEDDTLIFNTERIVLPSFIKGFIKYNSNYILLNTCPRTLGSNLKSTDFLTRYDKDFQVVISKDMDVSKYPSGNCFVLGNNGRLFYITDTFKFYLKFGLAIFEIDESFNIVNKRILKAEAKAYYIILKNAFS